MAGHVFVVKSDLRKLSCDAWLMPCGPDARPEPGWTVENPAFEPPPPPPGWDREERRAFRVPGWPADSPAPWLVNVGGHEGQAIGWYVRGAAEFLERAASALRGRPARLARAKTLLALPIVGTGGGGAKRAAGEVVRELLPALHQATVTHDVDVALVAQEEAPFTAAQAERSRATHLDPWRELDERREREAVRLADHAARGRLVLFIGGGVSRGAGLPLWDEMLEHLAMGAGMPDDERQALAELDPVDRARVIEKRLKGQSLADAVVEMFRHVRHHAISHALLAALPVEEIVTTNYDLLFEQASNAAGVPVRILPRQPGPEERRWVLKMHGSIEHPEDLVLTREDYLRYEEQRAALSGIVQALLITRHMLFVGFALRDENFHRIADAVRRAVRAQPDATGRSDKFGTVLALLDNPLHQELWEEDLYWTAMEPLVSEAEREMAETEAARRLEIFLDRVLAKTSSAGHLLHQSYGTLLSDPERSLARALAKFTEELPEDATRAPAWERVKQLLISLGWDERARMPLT